MDDKKYKDMIKCIEAAAVSRGCIEVFSDMVRCMAIALESPQVRQERHDELEKEYAQIKSRYTEEEFENFPRAMAIVTERLEAEREDYLGHVLELLQGTNVRNGQFFTPQVVAEFCAKISAVKPADYKPGRIITLNDPACGASVLMIAGAEELMRQGVQQSDILIDVGDVDGRACDISYVELSLLGYAAVIRHQDALSRQRYSPDRYTIGYYLHSMPFRALLRRQKEVA